MAAAHDASSRIRVLLRDQLGLNWRDKLPPCPEGERILAALSQMLVSRTTKMQQNQAGKESSEATGRPMNTPPTKSTPSTTTGSGVTDTPPVESTGGASTTVTPRESLSPASAEGGSRAGQGVAQFASDEEKFLYFKEKGKEYVGKVRGREREGGRMISIW